MAESLRSKTVANLGYNLLTRLLVFALSSATGIILARNLTSSDYGIVGFATIFIGFLQQFNDLGITSSVIQKDDIRENDLYTAFTLKVLLGFLIFLLSYFWGDLSRKALDNPAVKWVVIVLAANLFIRGLGFLPTTILTRDLKFKRLTVPQIGSQVTATIVGITTVYMGFRYWSIVLSNMAASVASVAIVWALSPVRLNFMLDSKAAKEHLKFGSHLFFAGLMIFVLFNGDNFIIGTLSGAAMLGFYTIAFNWSTKATDFIAQAIHNILTSSFSRVQQDTERLKRGYLAILEYVSFAAVLANTLLMILSRELLVLVLGGGTGKWLPALLALEILCVYGVIRAVLEPVGSIIVAIGRPSLVFKSTVIVAALQAACLYPSLRYFGIAGVAALVTICYSIQFLVYFPALHRKIHLPFSAVFQSVRAALISGCALAAFGFTLDRFMNITWFSMAVKSFCGCVLYLVTYGCLTKWKIIKDAKEISSSVLLKASQSAA